MEGIQLLWNMIPGVDDASRLRFLLIACGGAGAAWGLLRWSRKEDAGNGAKAGFTARGPAKQQAAREPIDVHELELVLCARIEARLNACPGKAGMGPRGSTDGITQDLQAAVERLASGGHQEALLKLQRGETGTAMAVLSITRAAMLRQRAVHEDEAVLARQQGALALLNDERQAICHYANACALDPDDAEGWNRLGALKLGSGDSTGAYRCYSRAIELGTSGGNMPAVAEAMGHLGLLLNREGERAEACAKWKTALDVFQQFGMESKIAEVKAWMREAACAG